MRRCLVIAVCLGVSACATPESRVRTALLDAGLSRPVASCMAQRMVDRLSLGQLRRLSSLSGLQDKPIGQLSVRQLLHKVRALGDPEILAVVSTAGLGCALAA